MRVMIVEDEENIREGLAGIIDWQKEGFERPILISGAVEALQYLETESVNVVITDLYMPVLNGIEFIRMLREQNQLCEVVILTGHERFDLAREAISLGVKGYLLKPVDATSLCEVLREIRIDIQEKMKLKDWVTIAQQKIKDYLPVIQNQFWNDLISGSLRELEEIKERAKYAEIQMPDMEISCLAIRKRKGNIECDRVTEEVALRQLIEEILKGQYIYSLVNDGIEIVICKGRVFRADVEIMTESIRQNLDISVCIGVSNAQKGILNCRELTREAIDAVLSIHQEQAVSYVYYKDIENKKRAKIEYPYAQEKELLYAIRFQKETQRELLYSFLQKIIPPAYSLEESRILLLQFLTTLGRAANDMGINVIEEFKNAESSIYKFQSVEEALFRVVKTLSDEKENMSKKYTDIMVQTAKKQMEEEYADPELSVSQIATEIGVTPNYLSRIFKNIIGETCIDFLTRLRMEGAKELLIHSGKKSYEVAEEVGYKNPNYFSALFKKYTGYTPKEYRERVKYEA